MRRLELFDPDLGRGFVTHRDLDAYACKTPTVRNVLRTASYFDQGAFRTREQVVEFYDRGVDEGLVCPCRTKISTYENAT